MADGSNSEGAALAGAHYPQAPGGMDWERAQWGSRAGAERKWTNRRLTADALFADTPWPRPDCPSLSGANSIWHLSDTSRKCPSKIDPTPHPEVLPSVVDGWPCAITQGQGAGPTGLEYSQGHSCSVSCIPFPRDQSCGFPLGASVHVVSSSLTLPAQIPPSGNSCSIAFLFLCPVPWTFAAR